MTTDETRPDTTDAPAAAEDPTPAPAGLDPQPEQGHPGDDDAPDLTDTGDTDEQGGTPNPYTDDAPQDGPA